MLRIGDATNACSSACLRTSPFVSQGSSIQQHFHRATCDNRGLVSKIPRFFSNGQSLLRNNLILFCDKRWPIKINPLSNNHLVPPPGPLAKSQKVYTGFLYSSIFNPEARTWLASRQQNPQNQKKSKEVSPQKISRCWLASWLTSRVSEIMLHKWERLRSNNTEYALWQEGWIDQLNHGSCGIEKKQAPSMGVNCYLRPMK